MVRTALAATLVFVQLGFAAGGEIPVPSAETFAAEWEKVDFNHGLWRNVLADHVDADGLVDYLAIKGDLRFREYLYRLANTNPAELRSADGRLAFWINAYNAFAINGVLETLPTNPDSWANYRVLDVSVKGIRAKGKGFFAGLLFVAGGQRYTLDEIEKAVILHKDGAGSKGEEHYRLVGSKQPDPRVHFALVCCARGCPELRREDYRSEDLDRQLDDDARRFVADETRARFDETRHLMEVSQLLKWYEKDITDRRMHPRGDSVAKFLSRFVDRSELGRSLARDAWKTSYITYDWTLNIQP